MQELSLNRYLSAEKIPDEEMPRSPTLSGHVSDQISSNLSSNLPFDLSSSVSTDLESFCHRQVEQLVGQLPLLGAWIVYRDESNPLAKRRRFMRVCEDRPGFDLTIMSELDSEVWLNQIHAPIGQKVFDDIYFYPLISKEDRSSQSAMSVPRSLTTALSVYLSNGNCSVSVEGLDQYLLLWAARPFSTHEQQTIQTQIQSIEDYLIAARTCCRQREKIQLLEQAIGRVEHQLRHQLATIGLYAQNINWGTSEPSVKEQSTVIQDTVRDISQNLKQLLTCSPPKKKNFSQENFQTVIQKVLQNLNRTILQKNIKVECSQNSLNFEADCWQIKQAFENLLCNAIEWSPWGGVVTCQWQGFRSEVVIRIRDRGPGFSAEDLQNAFTPYYSNRSGGTGLGLAIAKKIILDHHGSIWLENLPEGGAQVSVVLPRYASRSKS